MISGHNTDILHNGVVYHVQTEDKGLSNPVIESLIYVGGQVVVSKREGYSDLLEQEKGDQAIAERMDRQHRVLMAAIKSGRFDEQFRALLDSGEILVAGEEPTPEQQISAVVDAIEEVATTRSSVTDSAIDRVRITAEDRDQPLDEVVLQYLKAEKRRERLVLAMEENVHLALGSRAVLALHTSSSETGGAVGGVLVMVKLISTQQETSILSEGMTSPEGDLALVVQVPALEGGSAALIVSASSDIGSAEIKHLL